MCNLKGKCSLHIRGGGIFQIRCTCRNHRCCCDRHAPKWLEQVQISFFFFFQRKTASWFKPIKKNLMIIMGLGISAVFLINLRDIYPTPQRSCLVSRRKSPINGNNNHQLPCRGGWGEVLGEKGERERGETAAWSRGSSEAIEMKRLLTNWNLNTS